METALNVFLGESRNIRSSRGASNFSVFAKVEFKNESLGESVRHELSENTSNVNMDLTVSHTCTAGNCTAIESIIRYPILVSVFEVLPKDKKAKEEKSQLLGIGSLDLLPLLKGEHSIESSLSLYPLTCQSIEVDSSSIIEVNVKVSVDKPLLSEEDRDHGNILFLRVKGLYSLPDGYTTGGTYTYTVATPSPNHLINPTDVLAALGGEVKTSSNPDIAIVNKKWKWPGVSPANVGMASLISNSSLTPNAVEDEKGHLRSASDVDFRRTVECMKSNIIWNTELRAFLPSKVNTSFLRTLSECSSWPIELVRVLNVAGGKGKTKDEITLSYSGISYVDLSMLLYPGATKIHGAFPISPLIEGELVRKCNVIEKSIMDNIHRATTAPPTKPVTGGKRPGTAARQSVVSLTSQTSMTVDEASHNESRSYSDSKTYLLLEFELAKPLVPKRTARIIADRIIEYIPPRPPLPKQVGGVEKAINEYHTATVDVASLLLADYRSLYGEEVSKNALLNTAEASEERRKKLTYHLNKSGHYHAYKEHMKKSILELVRQKFINEASTTNQEELQSFLSKLYTYLVDEMHNGLSKTFSLEESVPDPPNMVDCDMLRQYALESEQMLDLEMADYYHKELLAQEDHISLHWYEYGVFHLLTSDYDKAEQCFKESISLDQKFVPALLLYGICCCINSKHKEADEILEFATTIDECNTIAWTIRGLCCELSGNTLLRDMSLERAYKLTPSGKKKTYIVVEKASNKKGVDKQRVESEGLESQSQAISEKAQSLVDPEHSEPENSDVTAVRKEISSPASESSSNNPAQDLPIQASNNNSEHGVPPPAPPTEAKELLSTSNEKDVVEFSPFIQTASYLLDVNMTKFAEMCLAHEHVFQSSKGKMFTSKKNKDSAMRPQSAAQKSGILKDEQKNTEDSKSVLPTKFISLQYDIAMGRLYMLNGDYSSAESYLQRAVRKDILNSNAIALLGHCLYLSEDFIGAKDYYQRAVEYVNPPAHLNSVLLRLADIYMKDMEYTAAKQTYLRACRHAPSSVTWKGVGIACYMLQDYDNSEDALSEANILNNLDPEIWAYLSLLCVKTNRPQEASQAASYALKTGLKNTKLMDLLPQTDP